MAKKIYPGNYVTHLSSYQTQGVAAIPGRVYYQQVGYALVDSTGGTSFDVKIGSPDLRGDDKPRADIASLVVPAGAKVYSLSLRVPDMRKDVGSGTAASGLVGTNTNRIKVADALANDNVMTANTLATNSADVAVASTTVAPVATTKSVITPVALAGAETLKVFVTTSNGTSAGATLTSTTAGGTPIIVEVCYYIDDEAAGLDDIHLPYVTES